MIKSQDTSWKQVLGDDELFCGMVERRTDEKCFQMGPSPVNITTVTCQHVDVGITTPWHYNAFYYQLTTTDKVWVHL